MSQPNAATKICLENVHADIKTDLTEDEHRFALEGCETGIHPLWIVHRIRAERNLAKDPAGGAPVDTAEFWAEASTLDARRIGEQDLRVALLALRDDSVQTALTLLRARAALAEVRASKAELDGAPGGSKTQP